MAVAITKIKRKAGDAEDTVRVKDSDGIEHLTRIEWREPTPLGAEGPDMLNMVVHILDPVTGESSMSITQALSNVELADPNFDPETLVGTITDELVIKDKILKNNKNKLAAFKDKVKKDQDINLKKENK